MEIILLIITAILTFTATNFDDLILLIIYFSQRESNPKRIILGQYLGFTFILLVSFIGFAASLLVNSKWVGLLGILPIIIGIKKLRQKPKKIEVPKKIKEPAFFKKIFNIEVWSVAAITFANSGDNLSIYIPLFINQSWLNVFEIIFMFLIFVALWCYAAYKIVNYKRFKVIIEKYGVKIMPWILIILGIFILAKNGIFNMLI
ncbi:MAG: cadmium resistance transporter [Candidatus Pacearchaeota archaeon]|jgi:cadmium resistance transport/sequestration family protein